MPIAPLPPTRTLDISFHTGRTLYCPTPAISTVWKGGVDVPTEYRAELLSAQIVGATCLGLKIEVAFLNPHSTHLTITHAPLSVADLSQKLLLTEYAGLFYIHPSQAAMITTHDLPIEDSSAQLQSEARRLLVFNLDRNPIAIDEAVKILTDQTELTSTQLKHIQQGVTVQTGDCW